MYANIIIKCTPFSLPLLNIRVVFLPTSYAEVRKNIMFRSAKVSNSF